MQKAEVGSNIIKMINLLMQTDNRTGCRLITVDTHVYAVPFYIEKGFDIAESLKNTPDKKTHHSIPMYRLLGT